MVKLYRAVGMDGTEYFINPNEINAITLKAETVVMHMSCVKDIEIPGDYFFAMVDHEDNTVKGEIELVNIQLGPLEDDTDVNDTEYVDDTPMPLSVETVELTDYPTLEVSDIADDLEPEQFDKLDKELH
jgi:hypothetical protein